MTDEVTEYARRLILSRKLLPGQRIRQAELAEMMGVSTMPVREALLRLVSEGMVVAETNRSFSVSMSTTPDGLRDMYWVHAVLAGELAARAWDRRTPELLAEMKMHHGGYVSAMTSGDYSTLFKSNWDFHSAIHHAAEAPAVLLVMSNTVRYFPDFSHDWPGWNEIGVNWQEGLLGQFTNGVREGARAVVHEYCKQSAELYVAAYWGDSEQGESE
jgi:DNA-binding GntR family transcriptional regulator